MMGFIFPKDWSILPKACVTMIFITATTMFLAIFKIFG